MVSSAVISPWLPLLDVTGVRFSPRSPSDGNSGLGERGLLLSCVRIAVRLSCFYSAALLLEIASLKKGKKKRTPYNVHRPEKTPGF